MRKPHLFDPRHAAVLEGEARKTWQNPDEILEKVEIMPDFVVADLGCGSGYFTIPLARKAEKVYGIDVQEEMLEILRQKIRKRRIKNIEPLLSKDSKIPLKNESVDLLLSINALHEFDDREKIIEEMWRVLKPNGKLLIADFKKEDTGFGPPVSIRIHEKQAVDLFEKKGFSTLKKKDLMYHYLLVFTKPKKKRAAKAKARTKAKTE